MIISYQGRLTDASGNLLGNSGTAYYFKFSIWDNPTVLSGNRIWPTVAPNSVSLTVRQGVFNANIGDTTNSYPDVLAYGFNTNTTVYLQIEVSSDNVSFQTLSPRQQITASAFAQLAGAVSGTSTPSTFGTTTPIGLSQVTIEATTSSSIPLSIRAAAGQTANLLQIQSAAGANLVFTNAAGGGFASSTLQGSGDSVFYGHFGIGTTTTSVTFGIQGNALVSGNVGVANLTATGTTRFNNVTYVWPSSVTAGNFLQTDNSGNLSWAAAGGGSAGFTDSGTVVNLTTNSDNLAIGTTTPDVRSVVTIAATSTTANGLTIKSLAGQTGLALVVQNFASSTVFSIDASGGFIATASSTATNGLIVANAPVQASSTLLVNGLATFYNGFIANASSTAANGLVVANSPFQASSSALFQSITAQGSVNLNNGFAANASSSIAGSFLITNGSLLASSTSAFGG